MTFMQTAVRFSAQYAIRAVNTNNHHTPLYNTKQVVEALQTTATIQGVTLISDPGPSPYKAIPDKSMDHLGQTLIPSLLKAKGGLERYAPDEYEAFQRMDTTYVFTGKDAETYNSLQKELQQLWKSKPLKDLSGDFYSAMMNGIDRLGDNPISMGIGAVAFIIATVCSIGISLTLFPFDAIQAKRHQQASGQLLEKWKGFLDSLPKPDTFLAANDVLMGINEKHFNAETGTIITP